MVSSHPSDELLLSYAAGKLSNALGLAIAVHIEKCMECQERLQALEDIGGEMWTQLDSVDVSPDLFDKLSQLIDENDSLQAHGKSLEAERAINSSIPKPLRRFLPDNLNEVKWEGWTSTKSATIELKDDEFVAKLYKIPAGKELPKHTHLGDEFTVVLEGAFSDQEGTYRAGDFVSANDHTEHQPKATEDGDCICFAVMNANLKMTGFFGKMMNPFIS